MTLDKNFFDFIYLEPCPPYALRITCKCGNEPEGVMDARCQVKPLDGRRAAHDGQRMVSAARWLGAERPSHLLAGKTLEPYNLSGYEII